MTNNDDIENKIYFSKYKPEKKIGEGSFGRIYSAINIHTNEKFALKMENKDGGQNLLESEAYVMCYLKGPGIPAVKSYGFSGEFNILVMELLSKSLEDIFQEHSLKFTLKTVCLIADQMIEKMEYVHNKHIIHRDIKPDNFVMGLGDNLHIIYLIDFGLAKKYRSSRTLQHIKFTNNKKLTGTARYASINALRGCEQSRRDDLEAIGYVLMYFLRGSLPWQGLKVDKREDRYKKIYEKKKSTTPEELCAGFPSEFAEYVNYTRNLSFEQDPDYAYLRGLFKKVADNYSFTFDFVFDWTSKESLLESNTQVHVQAIEDKKNIEKKEKDNKENADLYEKVRYDTNNNLTNGAILQTYNNNDTGINKQTNKPLQNNYKFMDSMNNANNERLNTKAANINMPVQVTSTDLPPKKGVSADNIGGNRMSNIGNYSQGNLNANQNLTVNVTNGKDKAAPVPGQVNKNEIGEKEKKKKRDCEIL